LGIEQRQIRIKFSQKTRKPKYDKPLPTSIKTIGDWIQVKRQEKNLTPCHLAAKMGIATALVRAWEEDTMLAIKGKMLMAVESSYACRFKTRPRDV
jgi:DNA-binding transcriptional regulator YiaG